MVYSEIWTYNAGDTWNPQFNIYCDHRAKTIKLQHWLYSKQKLDCIVRCYLDGELMLTYIFECKNEDMHASLYPKTNEAATTSLEREITGDEVLGHAGYLNTIADQRYLIYIQGECEGKDHIRLNSLMDKYPTMRRKSYLSVDKAVEGIGRIVDQQQKPVELGYVPYVCNTTPRILTRQIMQIPGVSAQKADELAAIFKYRPTAFRECVHDMPEQFMKILRIVWPDNVDGSTYYMVNVVYNYYCDDQEPNAEFFEPEKETTEYTKDDFLEEIADLLPENDPTVSICGVIAGSNRRAVLFEYQNGNQFWIPKSVIVDMPVDEEHLIIKKWFWDRKRAEVVNVPKHPKKKTTRGKK